MASKPVRPALVVVDFQEDFCPPNGSLAVPGGRDIAPAVNKLMQMPSFSFKVATQDWHPVNHVSFASNHEGKMPFESISLPNPLNKNEVEQVRLWPDHCVQESKGAELVPEFTTASTLDLIVKKGQDERVEMFSAFRDIFTSPCVSDSRLDVALKKAGVTHVFVVGLARDYCVRFTAIHAAMEGYQTYVVSDATASVDRGDGMAEQVMRQFADHNIGYITVADVPGIIGG